MDDIVTRLRQWVDRETIESDPAGAITAAADEIEKLRMAIRLLADQDATLSVIGGNVNVDMDCPYVTGNTTRYCTLTPFTLTKDELEAIKSAIAACEDITYGSATDQEAADTLKALLARTK